MEDGKTMAGKAELRFQCRHIFTDGRRCGSPALRKENFCYFHHQNRKTVAEPRKRKARRGEFALPLPEDQSAIQQGIGVVLQRIAENDVDLKRAGLLLYGYQTAAGVLPKPVKSPYELESNLVEEFVEDERLGKVAPEVEYRPRMSLETSLIKMHQRMEKEAKEEAVRMREEKFDMAQALSRAETRIKDLEYQLRLAEVLPDGDVSETAVASEVVEVIQAVGDLGLKDARGSAAAGGKAGSSASLRRTNLSGHEVATRKRTTWATPAGRSCPPPSRRLATYTS